MADSLIYQVSSRSDMLEEPFSRKDVVYIIDQNNGSYSGGQLLLETSQLANSGRWASYSEAYITLPVVLGFKADIDITASAGNAYLLGLKNGFHQFIDSISVDLNGTNVCQLTPYTNFFVSYKMMTGWSQDDVAKYGASTNFFPDTITSCAYNTALSATGNGVANNRVCLEAAENFGGAALNYERGGFNSGFRSRLYNLNYVGGSGITALLPSANAVITGMNVFQASAGAAAARIYYSFVNAKIRLKDLHDFFSQVPLLKGAFFKFTINLNTSLLKVNYTGANVMGIANAATDITVVGRTNPLMYASAETLNPGPAAVGNVYIGCGISNLTLSDGSAVPSHPQRACRLYVPLYTMQPSYEDQYVSMNPTKTIIYRDLYNYVIPSVSSDGTVNQLLTNGLVAPKSLVVIPILNKVANNNAAQAFDPVFSPFASEPATTSWGSALTPFNVQLSGINVFQSNQQYDYEAFLNELSRINAVNGGQTTGLGSGLIDEYSFSTLYRYYVCDLSRGYSSEDMVPKSVQLSCVNKSAKILDLYCFIEYERKISVDLRTGQVVQV